MIDDNYLLIPGTLEVCERAYLGPPSSQEWDIGEQTKQEFANVYRCLSDFVHSADVIVAAGGDPTGQPHEAKLADQWCKHCSLKARTTLSAPENLQEWVNEQVRRVSKFVYPVLVLVHRLADDPILVPTGQQKPRVRVRYVTHPQRSYQDVQNELAVQLANLPRFTAYASIQGEQHQIRLHPPVEGDIDEERIEQIRVSSKARFGRPPGSPDQPARGRISERATEPLVSPRITREHPAE